MNRAFKIRVGAFAALVLVSMVLARLRASPPMAQTVSAPSAPPQTRAPGLSGITKTNAIAVILPKGASPQSYNLTGCRTGSSESTLGYVQQAGRLVGASVCNLQGEQLGHVKSFIVDFPEGRVVAVIVSSGGLLGKDGDLSAVPPAAFRYNAQLDALQLDLSREALAGSPHFRADNWPDFSRPGYMAGVDRAYHLKPGPNSGSATVADHTPQDPLDHDRGSIMPLDQGGSPADGHITTRIRQAILASAGMSVNAQNVKINTIKGHVTLRGPVNTSAEKQIIGDIATRIAPPGNVDNLLEVELVTSN